MDNKNITSEILDNFINGKDPQKRIVNFECDYTSNEITVFSRNDKNKRVITKHPFYPFVWSTQKGAISLYNGNKVTIKQKMLEYGISCKGLNIYNLEGKTTERMENGYRVLFYSNIPLSYNRFNQFFRDGGINIYDSDRQFLCVTPVEQFMIQTGKRQFKGFDDYDDILRAIWDIETDGLQPKIHKINQIGIRTNTGFEHIIHIEGNNEKELRESEINAINNFFQILKEIDPDTIEGHNSENFDWQFVMTRCEVLGIDFAEITKKCFGQSIYKKNKKTVLKLGGEVEYFNQTCWYGHTVIDSLHACRRAQALDSNMKSGSLKYAAEYAKIKKPNRVYVLGDKISKIYNDKRENYILNETNGEWREIDSHSEYFLKDNEKIVNGEYIVNRYLMDDLYEGDKVGLHYNQSNFQLSKILPMTYQKACTAGTAGTWKGLLLAWSFENDLAIPMFSDNKSFTGGLSRLLKVGFVKDITKLDFNSLYPAITITYDVFPDLDISGIFKSLLNYILTEREKYKGLMKKAQKSANKISEEIENYDKETEKYENALKDLDKYIKEVSKNNNLQHPFKIFGNSFFGSYGCPAIFPWGDLLQAENITCIARQCLRLMVKWFEDRGFKAIVGDSVTGDTPLYVRDKKTKEISIKKIKEVFNNKEYVTDMFNRQYDTSPKNYEVLCRSGWMDINYVYRHKTNKKIYEIKIKNGGSIKVTEDHSLFNEKNKKINPKYIQIGEKIELYNM